MKNLLPLLLSVVFLTACDDSEYPALSEGSPFSLSDGYVLRFGPDFEVGRNFIDDFGISVALVVDVSGSMFDPPETGGDPKYVQAARALETVVAYLERLTASQSDLKIQVALLKFSNAVDTLLPMTVLDEQGLAQLKALARPESFEPDGGTAIGRAVEAGAEALAQSGTIFNSLIVVTDGENNGDPDPVAAIEALYTNRNSASTNELRITTSTQLLSFIGFDIESPQFQVFHEQGARVMSAGNQTELETSLKALLEADITKLEGN